MRERKSERGDNERSEREKEEVRERVRLNCQTESESCINNMCVCS